MAVTRENDATLQIKQKNAAVETNLLRKFRIFLLASLYELRSFQAKAI